MPKLDGFEVIELIDSDPAVVFVTAYDQYAMRAFDAAAVDYLLKPYSAERFRASLERVRTRLREAKPVSSVPKDLKLASRAPGDHVERIVVNDGPKVHVIPAVKLDYAEAQDDYVALRSEGRAWLKQQTISSLESALDPRRFIRLHRSYLVNVERIARGDIYGTFPDLVVGGNFDTDTGTGARGRWIPGTAVDEYASTLATWYGLTPSDLGLVFPSVANGTFPTSNLGFMMP